MVVSSLYTTWFLLLTLFASIEEAHHHRIVVASRELRVGMTMNNVIEVLGEPTVGYQARSLAALMFMRMQPKQIAYGTTFDLRNLFNLGPPYPFPWPIHILRSLKYADEDLVFGLSHEEIVVEIRRPDFIVPKQADDMLDAVYFVNDVFRFFILQPK